MSRTTMGKLVVIILAVLVLVAIPLAVVCAKEASAPAKVFHWKMQSQHQAGTELYERYYIKNFANKLRVITNGQLDITVYSKNALVPVKEAWKACSEGVFEVVAFTPSYASGTMPLGSMIYGLPGALKDIGEILTFHERGFGDLVRKEYNRIGLQYVASAYDCGVGMITTKPVRRLEDLKGMKVRHIGAIAALYEKLGAAVVRIPSGELYTALQTRVIEGAGYGAAKAMKDLGLQEVAKYYMLPHLLSVQECLTIAVNLEAWNSLPDNLKQAFQAVAVQAGLEYWKERHQGTLVALREFKEKWGVTVTVLPEEDVAKITKVAESVWDEFAKKDAACAEGVKMLKAYLKDLGRL